tara:strand:+ start:2307 stop:3227 length:921 start_codon:yes stop_codon:yes gene_type:complete
VELIESSGLFLTSRQRQLITGGFRIRDRRRKPDEPFNPFAANANQVRQKKRSERSAANATTHPNQTRSDQRQSTDSSDFRKKQEEARQRLGGQAASQPIVQKPAVDSKNLNQPAESAPTQQVSRADRLAELRKQSQESVKKTESILDPSPQQAVIAEPVANNPPIVESTTVVESVESVNVVERAPSESASSKNVFKQIVTTAPKKREHRRRRSRHDDTGGGRQPKVKKLNRQRYNDYKYAARDILEDESIADEHRSNLLGQIWAKGERIGVSATLEFIDEKEEQLIINNEVANKLRDLVKALTTRR